MRVLNLTYETPAYPAGGGPSRQHCLLEPLAARHRVRTLSTGGPPRFGRPPRDMELVLVDPGLPLEYGGAWLPKNLRHLTGRERPWIHQRVAHIGAALAARLPGELETFDPDVVLIQHGELGPLLDVLPPGRTTVLELHNMLVTVQRQEMRRVSGRKRLEAALELPWMARWEGRDLCLATLAVAATPADARIARRLSRRAWVETVDNCVDADYFAAPQAQGRRREQPPRMIFTASFHYLPNQDAAELLLREVLPAVRRRVPDAELLLVGQQPPAWLAELAATTAGAVFVGEVEDVRPSLWSAAVALAPLRSGSGSPIKALEALAAGVPVVASDRVGRALGLGAGQGLLTAAHPQAMAAEVCRVLEDAALHARLAAAALATVRRRFDRLVTAPRFEGLLGAAVRRHPARRR